MLCEVIVFCSYAFAFLVVTEHQRQCRCNLHDPDGKGQEAYQTSGAAAEPTRRQTISHDKPVQPGQPVLQPLVTPARAVPSMQQSTGASNIEPVVRNVSSSAAPSIQPLSSSAAPSMQPPTAEPITHGPLAPAAPDNVLPSAPRQPQALLRARSAVELGPRGAEARGQSWRARHGQKSLFMQAVQASANNDWSSQSYTSAAGDCPQQNEFVQMAWRSNQALNTSSSRLTMEGNTYTMLYRTSSKLYEMERQADCLHASAAMDDHEQMKDIQNSIASCEGTPTSLPHRL